MTIVVVILCISCILIGVIAYAENKQQPQLPEGVRRDADLVYKSKSLMRR